jgi:hypothetical protein
VAKLDLRIADFNFGRVIAMRRMALFGCAMIAGMMLLLARPNFGDDQTPSNQNAGKTDASRTANKPVGPQDGKSVTDSKLGDKTADGKSTSPPRLPSGWVRLGLTTDQHDKVIAVMVKYAPQIQQLEAQLAELKTKQHTEMTAVLTSDQKTQLAEAESKKASEKSDNPSPRRRRMRFRSNNNNSN